MEQLKIFAEVCWTAYKRHWKLYTALFVFAVSAIHSIQSSTESAEYVREKQKNYAKSPTEFMPIEKIKATGGDLIECKRVFGLYDHWGVYVGNGDVIHLIPNPDGQNNDQIRKDSIADFSHGSVCRINNLELAALRLNLDAKNNQEIKLAAFKYLDAYLSGTWFPENKYSLLKFNCEHFATYCRFGTPFSEMVNILIDKPIVRGMAEMIETVVDMDISQKPVV